MSLQQMKKEDSSHTNLGHTLGHAIENGMGYGACLRTVGTGMLMSADMSCRAY